MKKALFVLSMLIVSFSMLSFSPGKEKTASAKHLAVTNLQCVSYLEARGYCEVTVIYVYSNGNRLCDTMNEYHTMVYVYNNTSIVGHEDSPDI